MRKLYLDLEGQLKVMTQEENTIVYPEEERAMQWQKTRDEITAAEKSKKKKIWETNAAPTNTG